MPKSLFIRRAFFGAVYAIAMCLASNIAAQTDPGAPSAPDAKALLTAAVAANGAPDANAKPWHIKISFSLNDWYGKPESQGTFEEFWAAPDKVRLIYATSAFNQVEYITPSGIRRTGSRDSAPPEFTHIVDQFLRPIPLDPAALDPAAVQAEDLSLGNAKLSCLAVVSEAAAIADAPSNAAMRSLWARLIGPSRSIFCLSQSSPILRLTILNGGPLRSVRNGTIRFADHVFPQSVEEIFSSSPSAEGKQVYLAKLETIEPLAPADDAQFTPPPDAVPAPRVIALAERDTRAERMHHSYPQYDYELPGNLRSSHMAGLVIIALLIHTDGSAAPLRVVTGPPSLQQVSLEAVKKWTYKPFQQNGEPVEVVTTATLVYSLR